MDDRTWKRLYAEGLDASETRIRELEAALKRAEVEREQTLTSIRGATAKITAERDEAVRLVGDMYRATDIKSPTVEEFLSRTGAGKCKRDGCNEPLAYPGAVYCGAACCVLAEAGK